MKILISLVILLVISTRVQTQSEFNTINITETTVVTESPEILMNGTDVTYSPIAVSQPKDSVICDKSTDEYIKLIDKCLEKKWPISDNTSLTPQVKCCYEMDRSCFFNDYRERCDQNPEFNLKLQDSYTKARSDCEAANVSSVTDICVEPMPWQPDPQCVAFKSCTGTLDSTTTPLSNDTQTSGETVIGLGNSSDSIDTNTRPRDSHLTARYCNSVNPISVDSLLAFCSLIISIIIFF